MREKLKNWYKRNYTKKDRATIRVYFLVMSVGSGVKNNVESGYEYLAIMIFYGIIATYIISYIEGKK